MNTTWRFSRLVVYALVLGLLAQTLTFGAPFRLWSTYFGGAGSGIGSNNDPIGSNDTLGIDFSPDVGPIGSDDVHEDAAYAVAVNPNTGDTYVTGYTTSASGIAVAGFQGTLSGTRDAFVAKISASGVTQWATYYGGGSVGIGSDSYDKDTGLQIAVNPTTGDSYVVGITSASSGIATAGAHHTALAGTRDGFIVKLNSAGARQWGTYFGGSGSGVGSDATDEDAATAVAVDPTTGDTYVVGYTDSAASIATAGADQATVGGGIDGWLAKFNASGVRVWATYIGGSSDDYGKGVAVDTSTGDVYVVGSTSSPDGIASAGASQPNLVGYQSAFLAKFNASGAKQWATYYGGAVGSDDFAFTAGVGVAVNSATHEVYIAGDTNASAGIATDEAFQTSTTELFTTFLAKFDSNGVRKWGTYYGGTDGGMTDYAGGLTVDSATGAVFLAGGTDATVGLATLHSQQTLSGGNFDGFVAKFDSNGARLWGSFYGDTQFDFISGIALGAASGEVRVVGWTKSTFDMATLGSQSPQRIGEGDAFIASFNETPPAPPANDNFADPTVLDGFGSIAAQATFSATKESGEPNHVGMLGGGSVWFRWTAPSSGQTSMHTTGSKFDTVLAVYTGSSLTGLTEIASSNDFLSLTSKVAFNAVAGTTYRVAVDGVGGETGILRLAVGPVNDEFGAQIAIAPEGGAVSGSNVGASTQYGEPDHAGIPVRSSVWWSWTPENNGAAEINTVGSTFDTTLAIYQGDDFPLTEVASNTAYGGDQSRVIFNVFKGQTYQIAVASLNGSEGVVSLQVIPPPPPPANDAFSGRIALNTPGGFAANNQSASAEPGEPDHGGYQAQESLWWSWTAPSTGQYEISASSQSSYMTLGVYTGSAIDALTPVGNRVSESTIQISAVAGMTYQIAADSPFMDGGAFALLIAPPLSNDNFADRITLAGARVSAIAANSLATKEPGEPVHAGVDGGHSVWWTWTAPANGTVQIDTLGSSFDTVLGVYTGNAVNGLTEMASNDDYYSPPYYYSQSAVTFDVVAGTTYQIAVDGWPWSTGTVLLNINLSPDGGSYGLWLASHPSLTGADQDRNADPDHDGISNELEMVLGLNPTVSSAAGMDANAGNRPVLGRTATSIYLEYTVDPNYVGVSCPGRSPVTVTGQVATSLAPANWTAVAPISLGGDTYRIEVPIAGSPQKFLRLLVNDPNAP